MKRRTEEKAVRCFILLWVPFFACPRTNLAESHRFPLPAPCDLSKHGNHTVHHFVGGEVLLHSDTSGSAQLLGEVTPAQELGGCMRGFFYVLSGDEQAAGAALGALFE